MLELLSHLVDKSLVIAEVADGEIRYPLVFFVDHRPGGWLVTRMAD